MKPKAPKKQSKAPKASKQVEVKENKQIPTYKIVFDEQTIKDITFNWIFHNKD